MKLPSRHILWFFPVILLLVAVIVLLNRDEPEDRPASQAAALTVSLVQPEKIDWPDTIAASGAIEPWQEAVIGAEVNGLRLADLTADIGDTVRKGQLLARFDDAELRAALAQQRALLAQAEANAKRAETLRGTGAMSDQEILQYTTQAATARAQLEVQELQLRHSRVTAPDDGVISARSATLGSVAAAGTELFRMVRQNRLEWRAELTAAQLPRVEQGAQAVFHLPDGSTGKGVVRQVSPLLGTGTRTAIAYIDVDKDAKAARGGMFVSGAITVGGQSGIALPQTSVIRRDGFEYVFTVTPEGTARQRKITTGRRVDRSIEVISGLRAEEKVVGTGAGFLSDGDTVRVVEDTSPVAEKAATP